VPDRPTRIGLGNLPSQFAWLSEEGKSSFNARFGGSYPSAPEALHRHFCKSCAVGSYPFQPYEPANGVPNIPTASSAQMRKNTNKTAPQIKILLSMLLTILNTSSHNKPVPNSRTPIIAKSVMFQSTSVVNCMAMYGIDNSIAAVVKISINLLFFIVFLF
jgi:hypothetical protein